MLCCEDNLLFEDNIFNKNIYQPKDWTPSEISTSLWFDASDSSTITLNGITDNVTQWDDKSGNNRNAIQELASNQPIYDATEKSLIFIDDFLDLTENSKNIAKNIGEMNCWIVHELSKIDPAGQAVFFISRGDVATSARFLCSHNTGSSIEGFQAAGRRLDSDSFKTISNGTNSLDRLIQHVDLDWANSNGFLYLNANLDASDTNFQTNGNTSDTESLQVLIGRVSASNQQYTGSINELILIANNVTIEEKQKIEGYLAHKWSLTESLPLDHPYKNKSPKS